MAPTSAERTVLTTLQLSQQLRALRKSLGLTQAALGELLGVGQSRVAEIERDPGSISVSQMLQVLHALNVRLTLSPGPTPSSTGAATGRW